MLNIVSILIALAAVTPLLFGLLPFLGALNWLILPLGVVGLIVGTVSSHNTGRNLNLVVLAVAAGRLMLGGGLF
jgi:hypothetical protein